MKILIVDDQPEGRYLLETLLRGHGFVVDTAANGVEALEKALQNGIDLIIADILMPHMDGFQLCHEVKTNARLKHIAFVFYTATYTDPEDEALALSLGAVTFIRKPAEPDVFLAMLREVIRACEAGTLTPPPLSLPEEAVYLQAYNTRLVNKLTDKLLELERANLQLTSMYDRLQAVSQQLIDAQETERQSIARELHDEIGQALTAATLSLYLAQEVCGAAALPYLTDVNDIMARLLQQVRNMALDLRPVMLDDLGLSAAMQWYVDRQEQRSGLAIHLHLPSAAVRLPADLETACFRITQEALTNIMRHAQARQVWLDVQHDAEAVHLTIRDDGRGFDANAVRQRSTQDAHFGLLSMRERVELLGGQFTLSSEPGRGTTIQISIPLHTRVPAQRPRSAQP